MSSAYIFLRGLRPHILTRALPLDPLGDFTPPVLSPSEQISGYALDMSNVCASLLLEQFTLSCDLYIDVRERRLTRTPYDKACLRCRH